jgi:hypothetical protein
VNRFASWFVFSRRTYLQATTGLQNWFNILFVAHFLALDFGLKKALFLGLF